MVDPIVQSAADTLSSLEPLAGLGFAVGLAYLGLNPFRYRKIIEDNARNRLSELPDPSDRVSELEHFKWLRWIAGEKSESPGHTFGVTYGLLFRKQADVIVVASLVFLAALTLILGVALKIQIFQWASWFAQPRVVVVIFVALIFALILPFGLIVAGRRCVGAGIVRADTCKRQILLALQSDVRAVRPPPDPPATTGAIRRGSHRFYGPIRRPSGDTDQ